MSGVRFGENLCAGKQKHQTMERRSMRVGGFGQVGSVPGTVLQQVCDSELSSDINRPGKIMARQ